MNTISKHFSVVLMILFIAGVQACSYYENKSSGSCPDGSLATVEIAGDLIDNDCDGVVDEGDEAEEGDGNLNEETDDDGDGLTEFEGDCDDADASIYPGATEIADNGIDEDCDGADSTNPDSDPDSDGDGHPASTDCDDTNASIYPGAPEVKNNDVDEDCNGSDLKFIIPPGVIFPSECTASEATIYYRDSDGDGYGTSDLSAFDAMNASCEDSPPAGYANNHTDCNDSKVFVNPGAEEDPNNTIDDNCDGVYGVLVGEPDEGEEAYVRQLKFWVKNLNIPGSGINSTNWSKVYLTVDFENGKKLDCNMGSLAVPYPTAASQKGTSFNFIVDLEEAAGNGCLNVSSNSFDDHLQLDKIKRVTLEAGLTTTAWGIERLHVTAIFPDGAEQKFYKNDGVWAVVEYNGPDSNTTPSRAYPNPASSCLGTGAYGGFHTYPHHFSAAGPANGYNIPAIPNGTLVMSPNDYWFRVSLGTDDAVGSGTGNKIYFKFKEDCGDSGYIGIFDLLSRNEEKELRAYSPHIVGQLDEGFTIKLQNAHVDDLELDYYSVEARQAWATDGNIYRYRNTWDRRDNSPDEEVVLYKGESTTRGLERDVVNMD